MRLLPLALLSLAFTANAFASTPLDTARQFYTERKDAEAKSAFEALARGEPRNAEAVLYLGRLAMRARDVDTAVKHFEKAIELDPTKSAHHLELGGAYGAKIQSAGLLGKASLAGKSRKAMEKAVELDPNSVDARFGLVLFYSQAPSMIGGGMDKAHLQADAIIKLNPARGRIAKAGLFAREKKYNDAFGLYEEALTQSPDDYGTLYQVGRLAAESGERLDRGLEVLNRCLGMTPPANEPGHAPANWRRGNIFEKKGDKAAARTAYEAALAIDAKFEAAIAALKKLN